MQQIRFLGHLEAIENSVEVLDIAQLGGNSHSALAVVGVGATVGKVLQRALTIEEAAVNEKTDDDCSGKRYDGGMKWNADMKINNQTNVTSKIESAWTR